MFRVNIPLRVFLTYFACYILVGLKNRKKCWFDVFTGSGFAVRLTKHFFPFVFYYISDV